MLSILGTVILQVSYRYDTAIRIIPTFGVNYILIPILGGLIVFGEVLRPLQWSGIGLILFGVVLLLFRGCRSKD